MHNLRHFYYQNKEKIWKVVLLVVFILGIIYYIDKSIESNEKNKSNEVAYNNTNKEVYSDEQNKTYISDKSGISGSIVTEDEVEKINSTISRFLQYCKNQDVERAYNMLSADCKENEYNTLEKFKERYIKSKFDKESVYEIQKWIGDTYKISISKDLLSTGDVNNNQKQIEYITIVKEEEIEKLNISSYIGKKDINKSVMQNNIKITVLNKRTYMDYEVYDFKIENLSNKTIKIDSLTKTGTMYIEGTNGNKYNAHSHEIFEDELELKTKREIELSIKYASPYSSQTSIEKIVFENVILNYMEYKNSENKEKFKDILKYQIEL